MSYHTGGKSKKKKKKKVKGKKLITNKSQIQAPAPMTSTVGLSAEASSTLSNFVNQNTSKIVETETDIEIEEVTKEIVTKLYDGSNIRKFYGMDTMDIQTFISTVLKDVPVIQIDRLNDKNETVSSYEIDETDVIKQPAGMSNVKTNITNASEKDGKSDGKGEGK